MQGTPLQPLAMMTGHGPVYPKPVSQLTVMDNHQEREGSRGKGREEMHWGPRPWKNATRLSESFLLVAVAKAMWLERSVGERVPETPLEVKRTQQQQQQQIQRLAHQSQESWGRGQCEPRSWQAPLGPSDRKCRAVIYPACSWGLTGAEATQTALHKRS